MTALLEVRNLTRAFGALRAVDDVSFSVERGELLGLIGPNGAGKSTLYNLIAGAIEPTSGEIVFKGRPVAGWKPYQAARAGVARTFQIPKPYRHLSVIENVALSALLHDATVGAARDSARGGAGRRRACRLCGGAGRHPDGRPAQAARGRPRAGAAAESRPVRRDHGRPHPERGQGHDQPRRRPSGARHHGHLGRACALRDHEDGARASWCCTAAS